MQENDDINTAYLKMIIDWMKMTRQFSLAAASVYPRPNPAKDIKNGALDIFRGIIV